MTLTLRYTSSLAVFTDTLAIVAASCAPEMQSEGYVLVNDDNDDMGDFVYNPLFPANVTVDKDQTGELNEADDELMRIFFPKPPADTPGDDGSTGGGGDVTGVSVTVVGGNACLWRSATKTRDVQDSGTALVFSAAECAGGCSVYVEGLAKGTATVTATWTVGGRTVTAAQPITILELRMIVDGCHPDSERSDMDFDDFGKEDINHNKIMEDFGNYQSVFWVNDDCDYHKLVKFHVGLPYWSEEDVAPTKTTVMGFPLPGQRTVLRHDFRDDRIGSREACIGSANHCLRDLEDFNRLHILADPAFKNLVDAGKAQLAIAFNGVNANLFEAVGELRIDALKGDNRTKQAKKRKLALDKPEDIARHLTYQAGIRSPFIWEGAETGEGTMELVARIHGETIGRRKVRLKLRSVFEFLDVWHHTDTDSHIESECSTIAAGGGRRYPSDAFSNGAGNDQPYILVVHGFNVSAQEKKDWAATVFKRLWWLGYRGRVGMFQWNCSELGLGVVVNYDVYDESDKKAWEAGRTLATLLTELKDTGKCKVHVLAHSQGNVVTGSALRQLTDQKVETYIASQAAISLSCYKASKAEDCYHDKTGIKDVRSEYPGWGDSEKPFLEGALDNATKRYNYYNPKDYALVSSWQFSWMDNNEHRPDIYYWHDKDRVQAAPAGCKPSHFYYRTLSVVRDLFFPLDASQTAEPLADTYEIFTMASPAWLGPLGATDTRVGNFESSNLQELGYNDKHYSHSRQFLSNFYAEKPYWSQVLENCNPNQQQ